MIKFAQNYMDFSTTVYCDDYNYGGVLATLAAVTESLLLGAMEEMDPHQLSCSLLLARQASLEGAHLFPPYPQWFQVWHMWCGGM